MIHNRATLLGKFVDMKLSHSTRARVANLFPKLENSNEEAEALAAEINKVLDSCKNEEEVLRKMAEKYPEFE